ncbi:type ISP restriction/modification enzyme [Anaerobiospirillum succiniciproducens]|uniref:type ISP restriction/modification enzyme n=1 Tax=Anaerobiospirillum succiniciproducens TaxID=13335 RepID=UPI002355C96F|nr:type ISP restriction/modification enzyme [Anaerobiospirillum succiniciproducens]MCI6862935.1 DEAD/DEAH box helicase family protein [Anaerobiospirillum succiniciproducens]
MSEQIQESQRDINGVFNVVDNATAFNELLKAIEASNFSQRDKGTDFERLSLDFLTNEPTYKDQFTKVQMYSDWAKENKNLEINAKDIGVDLVATDVMADEGQEQTYTAIQCKFYAADKVVSKDDIDSFLSASDKKYYSKRFIIATNQKWGPNVQKELKDLKTPVTIITREKLANSSIDWSSYLKTQGKVEVIKRTLRDYQKEALNNVIEGFKTNERGKLIMACGTGKTFTSLRTAEAQVGQHGLVLFLVPSLSLLSQTLSDWKQQAIHPMTAFAVCSDSKIGKSDELLTASELAYPATTDAKTLAKKVNDALAKSKQSADGGMTVVFSTYQSIDVIAVAQNGDQTKGACVENPMPEFDLIICDEAHRTAGAYLRNQVSNKASNKEATNKEQTVKDKEELSLFVGSNVIDVNASTDSSTDDSSALTESSTEDSKAPDTEKANKSSKKRTASINGIDEEEAAFTRIHNKDYVKGKKRLYMTATPKVYGTAALEQKNSGEAVLYSMDDEENFGPVFHTMNFEKAVKMGCLVDYKVIILVGDANTFRSAEEADKFSDNHASRVVGAWKALNKYGIREDLADDLGHMRRAVGFAQQINHDSKRKKTSSKDFAVFFQRTVDKYRDDVESRSAKFKNLTEEQAAALANDNAYNEYCFTSSHNLKCSTKHIDGSMDALEKAKLLSWLREEPQDNECKILFNVRCLSEGVDVPSLDSVIFLAPRKSQVDVVQTVGRVMRIAPGKKRGYVIIPIVAEDVENPEKTLERSDEFKVVWQVLNALRSINPSHELVDGRIKKIDDRIEVISVVNSKISNKASSSNVHKPPVEPPEPGKEPTNSKGLLEDLDYAVIRVEEAIKTAIIKKLGNIRTWEDWAKDVALICSNQAKNIKRVLEDTEHPEAKKHFDDFKNQMSAAINGHITKDGIADDETATLSDDEFIDMLAQHIVIKPVLDELFKEHPFTEKNAIASSLTQMLETLQLYGMQVATNDLKNFYESVGYRMKNVKSLADRQTVIVDLFDRFFKVAFPKQQEKLGIVYTPIEVVDFINHSVNDILKKEFKTSLGDQGVHILDPFTGTGTFITRMMSDESIIPRASLPYKYQNELHAFELVPLSYYVASINIESVYDELKPNSDEEYEANNVTVLTDTFATHDADVLPLMSSNIQRNASLRQKVDKLPLRVIIGNPPYHVGQSSGNDNNQNEHYPELERRVEETYVAKAGKITNKNSLYNSYIKAFRWASDKIGESGVIGFITNAGWLAAINCAGIRRCFVDEFNSIYVYNLKGEVAKGSSLQNKQQGGNVFQVKVPVAVTILVKNPESNEHGVIRFGSVDDYLTSEQKLDQLEQIHSISGVSFTEIKPDDHGDWLSQRRDDFSKFISVDGKNKDSLAVFVNYSRGVATGRDVWSFNSSRKALESNFTRCIDFYNEQIDGALKAGVDYEVKYDPTMIKWNRSLLERLAKRKPLDNYSPEFVVNSIYRPFIKQYFYNYKPLIDQSYQISKLFPYADATNLVIGITGLGAKEMCCFATNVIPCLDSVDKGQWYPRYVFRKANEIDMANGLYVDEHGYVREDAIKADAVEYFRSAYGKEGIAIDADALFYYLYGILHSRDYREKYAANLAKERPRIPRVETYAEFKAFEQAGRELAKLHVNYESVTPYNGCTIEKADNVHYRVEKLAYGKIKGKKGNSAKDKTCIVYNDTLTIKDIPLEAQEYIVTRKSALDWIVTSCCVKTPDESGIVNDYNDYATEVGDEKYIFNLILRVITVSLETVKIVNSLPKLNIHPLDR